MKGQATSLGLAIVVGIMIFFAGVYFMNPIKTLIGDTRLDLQCATPASLTDGGKMTCLVVDAALPYLIVLFISLAVGGIVALTIQ